MGRMDERRLDGKIFKLHLATHTKTFAKKEAKRLRNKGWNSRVIPLEKNYWGIFTRKRK